MISSSTRPSAQHRYARIYDNVLGLCLICHPYFRRTFNLLYLEILEIRYFGGRGITLSWNPALISLIWGPISRNYESSRVLSRSIQPPVKCSLFQDQDTILWKVGLHISRSNPLYHPWKKCMFQPEIKRQISINYWLLNQNRSTKS